jgi:hypothetical protein
MDRFEGPYWVVGGEYADTSFRRLAPGAKEERIGPFHSYESAYKAWRAASWRHVDQCNWRYRIVEAGEDGERKAA